MRQPSVFLLQKSDQPQLVLRGSRQGFPGAQMYLGAISFPVLISVPPCFSLHTSLMLCCNARGWQDCPAIDLTARNPPRVWGLIGFVLGYMLTLGANQQGHDYCKP